MTLTVANLPTTIVAADVTVYFTELLTSAATALTHSGTGTSAVATIECLVPRKADAVAAVLTPYVLVVKSGITDISATFPASFEYQAPPDIAFASLLPASGPLDVITQVSFCFFTLEPRVE